MPRSSGRREALVGRQRDHLLERQWLTQGEQLERSALGIADRSHPSPDQVCQGRRNRRPTTQPPESAVKHQGALVEGAKHQLAGVQGSPALITTTRCAVACSTGPPRPASDQPRGARSMVNRSPVRARRGLADHRPPTPSRMSIIAIAPRSPRRLRRGARRGGARSSKSSASTSSSSTSPPSTSTCATSRTGASRPSSAPLRGFDAGGRRPHLLRLRHQGQQ